jgi:hypothetical protein
MNNRIKLVDLNFIVDPPDGLVLIYRKLSGIKMNE